MASDDDQGELTGAERRALDDWATVEPPPGFADRVLAAQHGPATPRFRRLPILAAVFAAAGVVALLVAVTRNSTAADGTLSVTARTTAELGNRATIVAEPAAALRWHVAASGAADIDQTAGDVFYRVERGGPFVIHTPAGDVRVTGTCLRIEVLAMKPTNKMLVSGAVGAAFATAVVVTVYEGHVIADSRAGSHTDLVAGSRATLDGTTVSAAQKAEEPAGLATATRDQLAALATAREDQIIHLKSRLAELEARTGKRASDDIDTGHLWHDPSHDQLVDWAASCHIRYDEPSLDRFTPLAHAEDLGERGLQTSELDGYNSAMSEMQKQWQSLVRSLYVEVTGDAAGADSLSIGAMQNEIREKSPPGESGLVLQRISRERAGLAAPPTDLTKTSPLERLMRAQSSLGDQSEQTLAKRIGAERAHEIRGDGWGARSDSSGCPKSPM